MSVRKRTWGSKDDRREAWVADYVDQQGTRRLKTFDRKKDADAYEAKATVEVSDGTHVADSASVTVKEAGAEWLASAESVLERSTLEQYRQHLRLHIEPILGRTKLSQLNVPTVTAFRERLQREGRSPTLTRYVVRSLGSLLAYAQEKGLVVRNTVHEVRGRRRRNRKDAATTAPRKRKLQVGVDIPTPAEIKGVVQALDGSPWRPLFLTAIFTGLRASELRGLTWDHIDFSKAELKVRQRADRWRSIGEPKTEAGERTVPLPPIAVSTLREWKLQCPKGKLRLVFPNGKGNVEFHVNIIQRGLIPTMIAAGLTAPALDKSGKPRLDESGKPLATAKYSGMHAFRHFYASWCINRRADGGMELPAKVVQERLGHSSITVTLDTYGHLFPRGDDGAELAEAERALLG